MANRRYGFHSGKVNANEQEISNGSYLKGKQKVNVTTVAGATASVGEQDYIISSTYTATGAVTIDIPSDLVTVGRVIIVNDTGATAGSNNIVITTEASETIDGSATATISANNGSIALFCDGTNWFSF